MRAAIEPLAERGFLATCALVEMEMLYSSRNGGDRDRVRERHGVTVLHYDGDYDLIAELTGQVCAWVVPRGTAD